MRVEDRARRWARRLAVFTMVGAVAGLVTLVVVAPMLGYRVLVVRGASMGSTAPLGSVVVGRGVASTDVSVGDTILIRRVVDGRKAMPVLHRVIARDLVDGEIVVRTQGDANAEPDPQPYVLRGTAVVPRTVIPYVGFIVGFVATRAGWMLLVAIPCALLTVSWLRAIWRPRSKVVLRAPATV